ncbi:MAG: low specificity L-threonine aldolase [Thermoanaerobaculia bacterium]
MSESAPAWKLQFASDNTAPISPEALDALYRANEEPRFTLGYGDDPVTRKAVSLIRDLFETDCEVFFVFNGSAANSLALASICSSYHGALCHPFSHADTDEANMPEFFTGGAKLIHVDGPAGKIDPAKIPPMLERGHGIHSAKIRAVTLTQATEVAAVYTPEEIRAVTAVRNVKGCEDFRFHMDGARFANALAFLGDGVTPADLSWKAGIDVLSFGGAKNGLPATEALLFFDRDLARDFEWRRKQSGQLSSKMRYQAAPWIGVIESGAWLENAKRANACAKKLGDALAALPGVELRFPVEANGVFVRMPERVVDGLYERGWHFYPFSVVGAWRLMCNWATSDEAVEAFVADVKELLG